MRGGGNYTQLTEEESAQAIFLTIDFYERRLVVEISPNGEEYCAYSQLTAPKTWFCIDSTGKVGWTNENPAQLCGMEDRYECSALSREF